MPSEALACPEENNCHVHCRIVIKLINIVCVELIMHQNDNLDTAWENNLYIY